MVHYTQLVFNKHDLPKYHQIGQLIKPIASIIKNIGIAPAHVIGPSDLDKVEQLADGLNMVFDTLEARRQAEVREEKAEATTAEEEKAGQEAPEPSAVTSASVQSAEEPSTSVENATSHPKGQVDQQASSSSSADIYPQPHNYITRRCSGRGSISIHTHPSNDCSGDLSGIHNSGWILGRSLQFYYSQPIEYTCACVSHICTSTIRAGLSFGGFDFTAAGSTNYANGIQKAAANQTPVDFAFGATNSASFNFAAAQPQHAATGTAPSPFVFQTATTNSGGIASNLFDKTTGIFEVDIQEQKIPGAEEWTDPFAKFQPAANDAKHESYIETFPPDVPDYLRGMLRGELRKVFVREEFRQSGLFYRGPPLRYYARRFITRLGEEDISGQVILMAYSVSGTTLPHESSNSNYHDRSAGFPASGYEYLTSLEYEPTGAEYGFFSDDDGSIATGVTTPTNGAICRG
ncbi:hypothetical protein E8E11_003458 [Didymella keratinophila]|nr:hypothetical protein E8E11_003458 [Didymella keratinophila]